MSASVTQITEPTSGTRNRAGYNTAIDINDVLREVCTSNEDGSCTYDKGWSDALVALEVKNRIHRPVSRVSVATVRSERFGYLRLWKLPKAPEPEPAPLTLEQRFARLEAIILGNKAH